MNLRRLFLYFILSSFCILPLRSQDPREKEMTSWDRVEHLLEQGRPASALPLAESLLRSAKARGHTADVVKALFYVFRCKEEFTEDSYLEFLRIIDQEIASAPEPLRQLLWSVRAQLLYTYFRDFLWQIKSRSPLADTIQKDIRFWDERRFRSEVYRNLWNSLQNPTLLKQVPQEKVQELLTGDKQLFYIYPTLYDFLAFRALDFLLGTDAPSEDDIEQISLANPRLWGPSEEFLQVPLPESGSNSPINAAFLLLKELTAFHLRSANLNALTAVDLKRFKFLNKYGTMARKPWYYKQALTRIITARPTILHTAEVGFELAAWYQTHGQSWKPAFNKAPDSTAFYLYNAGEVCRKVIKAFPKSPGAKKCKNLLEQILDSHLNLVIPSHTRQGKPTLACLQYKNLTQCVVTVLSCRPEEYDKFYQDDNPYDRNRVLRFLSGLRSVHRIDLALPKDTLMHSHATYFKIPPLEPGYYIIVCAQGSDPLPQDRSLGFCYKPIISSDVVWFSEKWKQAIRIGVWNSLTDKPAKGTSIKVFRQEYDYPRRRYEDVLISEGITNEKGYFTFKYSRPYPENLKFVMYRQGIPIEVLKTWNNAPRTLLPESERVTFFTDRSLYRPGQTVHFKAVVTSGEPMPRTRLLPEYTIQVQLKDPNGRVLYDQEHTTGKMGSFWGQIILPTSGLTGLYTLMAGKSQYTFRVEEYKRPRFEVKLSPVKPEGLLGEEVRVRGTCVTLAGVPVTSVPVAIRVTRRLSPKMWRLSGPLPERPREETLVAAGILQPNDSGSFYIQFKALPDDRYLADSTLIYEFHVLAECTDLTGETRSANLSLLYSYMPYTLSLEFPKVLIKNISPLPEIHVNALNQGPVEGLIRLKVKKALPTGRWPLHTSLPPADVRLIPPHEFVKDFPHHLNAGETDDSLLTPGPVILDTVIAIYGKLVIPRQRLEALPDGVYILEANTLPAQGAQHRQRFTVTLCSD
ncbi:MAG: MG2 domain-containing protein, partial [Flavobacteriales bacterium]|nr:MG2 domain-containing protein [Flavobacteriales bacterium]MDW8409488.1 MG2 domain-containing protein [Flavobacteriales bacterium]